MEPVTLLRVGIYGHIKTGKTTFALKGWPTPLIHYDLDMGFERAEAELSAYRIMKLPVHQPMALYIANAITQGVDIITKPYPTPIKWAGKPEGNVNMWNELAEDLRIGHENEDVKTIVIDTSSMMHKIRTAAQLEFVQRTSPQRVNLIQIEYGQRNDDMRGTHNAAKSYGKNLVLVHHISPVYEDVLTPRGPESRVIPGRFTWDGFGEMGRYVDAILQSTKITQSNTPPGTTPTYQINIGIEVCGYALGAEGTYIPNAITPTANFQGLLDYINLLRSATYGAQAATP